MCKKCIEEIGSSAAKKCGEMGFEGTITMTIGGGKAEVHIVGHTREPIKNKALESLFLEAENAFIAEHDSAKAMSILERIKNEFGLDALEKYVLSHIGNKKDAGASGKATNITNLN